MKTLKRYFHHWKTCKNIGIKPFSFFEYIYEYIKEKTAEHGNAAAVKGYKKHIGFIISQII